ncbi:MULTISPECIES: hypothetical protein [unclassified Leisingera]|uniref:hypothetical protein n=1 Tax=unclassified Leisingera TaxID=2614906 RepID=UPI0002D493DD|nr:MULTISPECIES: hypothetical protein [unclassified Leisingera]KIC25413.1 hypothetical protein RA23_06005 [Leisingera sp. ANG-S3]KIC54482.1 hypothetical protein RA22_07540 [Leisingera sp. ANG-S]KID10697.1 hypothetical protein GC1_03215 [Leisingera sp. ANG1]
MHNSGPCTFQELYSVERNMRARCRFGQAMLLQELGGKITPASTEASDRFDYETTRWHASLLGVCASGNDLSETLNAWMRAAQRRLRNDFTRRATDGRPDCPYNGAAMLPPDRTRVAEAT